jgi:hypothetical protein
MPYSFKPPTNVKQSPPHKRRSHPLFVAIVGILITSNRKDRRERKENDTHPFAFFAIFAVKELQVCEPESPLIDD